MRGTGPGCGGLRLEYPTGAGPPLERRRGRHIRPSSAWLELLAATHPRPLRGSPGPQAPAPDCAAPARARGGIRVVGPFEKDHYPNSMALRMSGPAARGCPRDATDAPISLIPRRHGRLVRAQCQSVSKLLQHPRIIRLAEENPAHRFDRGKIVGRRAQRDAALRGGLSDLPGLEQDIRQIIVIIGVPS